MTEEVEMATLRKLAGRVSPSTSLQKLQKHRHSREGGNPDGTENAPNRLDSRLRGSDGKRNLSTDCRSRVPPFRPVAFFLKRGYNSLTI